MLRTDEVALTRASIDLQQFAFIFVPAPLLSTFAFLTTEFSDEGSAAGDANAQQVPAETWRMLSINFVMGIVVAGICFLRQRRLSLPQTTWWVTFVFVFGLPGLIGYLFHRRWPTKMPCPACQRLVFHDRPICPACRQPFPEPAADGKEILSPATI